MTKMAAMPVYGKNLWKSSFLELIGQCRWNIVYIYYQICSNDDPKLIFDLFT